MKLHIKQNEAHKIGEHAISCFTEYPLPFKTFSMGVSEVNGRYPASGEDIDTGVEGCWYVQSGKGQISVSGKVYNVAEGDMLLIPKNAPFWINGIQLKLVVTSSPPWTPDQHKHIG